MCQHGGGAVGSFFTTLEEWQSGTVSLQSSLALLSILNIVLACDLVSLLLRI
jgi:hypothetical protein